MQKIGVKSNYMQKLHPNEMQFFASALMQVLTIKKFYTCDETIIETRKLIVLRDYVVLDY